MYFIQENILSISKNIENLGHLATVYIVSFLIPSNSVLQEPFSSQSGANASPRRGRMLEIFIPLTPMLQMLYSRQPLWRGPCFFSSAHTHSQSKSSTLCTGSQEYQTLAHSSGRLSHQKGFRRPGTAYRPPHAYSYSLEHSKSNKVFHLHLW